MAIYHLDIRIVSRKPKTENLAAIRGGRSPAGKSVVAAAAYRAGQKLADERQEREHDYSRTERVHHSEIMLPKEAPERLQDRATLWNEVEASENRKDAQLAREVQVALPKELTLEQNKELLRDYVQEQFVKRGMIADVSIHGPGPKGDLRNQHAHILLTTRSVDREGFGQKNREWNDRSLGQENRQRWAELTNKHLEKAGHEVRIDHRTLDAQRQEAIKKQDWQKVLETARIPRESSHIAAFGRHRRGQESTAWENRQKSIRDPERAKKMQEMVELRREAATKLRGEEYKSPEQKRAEREQKRAEEKARKQAQQQEKPKVGRSEDEKRAVQERVEQSKERWKARREREVAEEAREQKEREQRAQEREQKAELERKKAEELERKRADQERAAPKPEPKQEVKPEPKRELSPAESRKEELERAKRDPAFCKTLHAQITQKIQEQTDAIAKQISAERAGKIAEIEKEQKRKLAEIRDAKRQEQEFQKRSESRNPIRLLYRTEERQMLEACKSDQVQSQRQYEALDRQKRELQHTLPEARERQENQMNPGARADYQQLGQIKSEHERQAKEQQREQQKGQKRGGGRELGAEL